MAASCFTHFTLASPAAPISVQLYTAERENDGYLYLFFPLCLFFFCRFNDITSLTTEGVFRAECSKSLQVVGDSSLCQLNFQLEWNTRRFLSYVECVSLLKIYACLSFRCNAFSIAGGYHSHWKRVIETITSYELSAWFIITILFIISAALEDFI